MTLPKFALSVRQPWAWAIIHAGKDVENRNSKILCHRGARIGAFAVHASKGMTKNEYEAARGFMLGIGVSCPPPDQLQRGCIIGSVKGFGVTERHFSDWFFGPYALTLLNPVACEPVPVIGQLGFFEWVESGQIEPPKPWMKKHASEVA